MPPDISIITPWLDHPEFIADYERSISAPGVEVIVVDNGSATLVAQTLAAMVGRLGGKYIRNEENRWFSAANNQGLSVASGRIVLFMNNDIVASSNWLDAVRQDVTPGGLYGPSLRKRVLEETETDYLEGWCIAGVREIWDALQGWNARTFQMPYWEDAELGIRARRKGIGLYATKWPIVHKLAGTSGSVSATGVGIRVNKDAFLAAARGKSEDSNISVSDAPAAPRPLELYIRTGRLSDAERDYRNAVEQEPKRADLRLGYSLVLMCCGRGEASQAAFQEALRLNPAIAADAFVEMGILFDRLKKYEEAASAFAEVARRRPESWVARCNWAAALTRAGKYEAAANAARLAIALNSSWGPAHGELANALLQSGRVDEAFQAAQTASRLQPPHLPALYVLGMTFKRMGKLEDALVAFDRALAVDPAEVACQQQRNEVLHLRDGKKQ